MVRCGESSKGYACTGTSDPNPKPRLDSCYPCVEGQRASVTDQSCRAWPGGADKDSEKW